MSSGDQQNKPSLANIKRLFAHSGNRCAFPKCQNHIVLHKTVVGEICHIKAASKNGPRYDPDQIQAERHSYENLILLCSLHHKVVDDDVVSYSVERLHKMKITHESQSAAISAEETDEAAQLIAIQSVVTFGQSGGIAAQNVSAGTINISGSNSSIERRILATERLWSTVVRMREGFSSLIYADTVFTAEELDQHFTSGKWQQQMSFLQEFAHIGTVVRKFEESGTDNATAERPFVSDQLWSLFSIERAILGRIAFLFGKSFREQRYSDWRQDTGVQQILSSAFSQQEIDSFKQSRSYALQTIIDRIEHMILTEARSVASG